MNDKKERVYSEEDLCEYTILQKIDELERQLQGIKSEFNGLYETKVDANNSHTIISDNIASVDNDLQVHIKENVREFRNIRTVLNNFNNIIPNDIGVKDNKLGLKNGNTWLTNLNAMNLEGFTYDEATNTLKASGDGGGAKIYRHCISILQNTANDKLEAYLTYYTTSQSKFDMTTLKNICPEGKTYECSGYYVGGSGKGPITNLVGSTYFPFLKYGNITASSFSMNDIILDDYRFTLNDEVSEVN